MASVDEVYVTVRGIGGHGARPHKTKDPVVIAAQIILALQTIVSREILALEPAVVTVGQIHGGTKCNIIPDEVKMDLTVRTYSEQVREHILSAIKRISEGIAMAAGVGKDRLPIVYVRDNPCPALYNSPELVKRVNKAIAGIIGSENITAVAPKMGGEDFAHYRYQNPSIPSYYFFIGATAPAQIEQSRKTKIPLPGLHTSRVAPVAEPTIKTGVKAMTAAVLDLMRPKED
jgi:hippurate hydrolase